MGLECRKSLPQKRGNARLEEKLIQRRMEENTRKNSIKHGTSKNLVKKSAKVAVGQCPRCDDFLIRDASCTHAACDCESTTLVRLKVVEIPWSVWKRIYNALPLNLDRSTWLIMRYGLPEDFGKRKV